MRKIIKLLLAVTYISPQLVIAATTANINFHVKLITTPCIVDGPTVIPVDLGKQTPATIDSSQYIDFSIPLKGCPVTQDTIALSFAGEPDGAAGEYIKNSGTAANVAIEIKDKADDTLVSNGSTISRSLSETNTANFTLKARMVSVGQPSGGTVSGIVNFTIIYP